MREPYQRKNFTSLIADIRPKLKTAHILVRESMLSVQAMCLVKYVNHKISEGDRNESYN